MTLAPLTVFHVTDVHGRIKCNADPWPLDTHAPLLRPGGPTHCYAGLAALEPILVQQAALRRRLGHAVMFVSCGDLLGIETAHDWIDEGRTTLEALEALTEAADIDICIHLLGNHAIDCGVDALQTLREHASRFEFVSGNVEIDNRRVSRVVRRTIEVGGWRLGLLNLTTTLIRSDARPVDRLRLVVKNPLGSARAALARVDTSDLDALLGVVHLPGHEDDAIIDTTALDALMGGHTHTLEGRPMGPSGWYAKAGYYAMVLGVLTLERDADEVRVVDDQTWLQPALDPPGPDSRVMHSFKGNRDTLRLRHPDRYRAIAALPSPIGSTKDIRRRETSLGRLVAETMRALVSTPEHPVELAFINGGNVRADLEGEAGEIAPVHLRGVVPYANSIFILELGLVELRRLLATSVANARVESAGFLVWAGLRAEFDAHAELGPLCLAASGEPIDPDRRLRVATFDYLAEGGHHCAFVSAHIVERGPKLVDAWIEHLRDTPDASVHAPTGACVTMAEEITTLNNAAFIDALERIYGQRLTWLRERLS